MHSMIGQQGFGADLQRRKNVKNRFFGHFYDPFTK